MTEAVLDRNALSVGQIVIVKRPDLNHGKRGHIARITPGGDCLIVFLDGRRANYHKRWLSAGSLV